MAKDLLLTNYPPEDYNTAHNNAKLNGAASWWATRYLTDVRGASAVSATVATVAGPTNGLEATTGGLPLEWVSLALSADFTIAGTITANLWVSEATMNDNIAANFVLEKIDGATGAITQICKSARVTEEAILTLTAANFTATPTSTLCKRGDRLRVRVFADDAGTMGSGGTFTLSYNAATAAASGDSWIRFTENLTFDSSVSPAGTKYYLTDTAETINPGAAIEKKMARTRGGGSVNAVTNTAAGPTSGIQITSSAGGTALEWYTPPLEAVTLGGKARLNLTVFESNAAANAGVGIEIAVCDGDGSGAVAWARANLPSDNTNGGEIGTASNNLVTVYPAGADVAVTAGQRLRIRIYVDDVSNGPLVAGNTVTVTYNGTTTGPDSNIILPVVVVEASTGPTTWTGSATVSLTDTRVTAATRQTFVAATVALADVVATAGSRKALGAASVALVDTLTTAARRVGLGAATVALVNSRVTNATRKTLAAATVALVNVRTTAARFTAKSGSAVALTDTITTNGTASAGATTYVGAATVALTDSRVTAARVTMKSGATVALTDGRVTNATRIALAAATVALTNTRVTLARFTAKAPTSTAEVVAVTTAARRVLVAAATVALTNLRTTAARITARSASPRVETVTVSTNGVSGAGAVTYFGSATVALTDARVTNATRTTYSGSTVSLVNVRVTAARVTFRGASVVALTNSRTTVAVRRANASASVQLANVRVTAARLTAKAAALTRSETVVVSTNATAVGVKLGAATVALTDARTTNGVRKTFSATTVALTNVRVTGAVRKAFGVVSRVETVAVSTNGTATVGAQTYFGAATVQLTDARVTAATRRTFGVVSRIETATVTTRGARVWFGATSTSETVTVTTGSRSRTNAAATVALRALLFTSAESIVPLPPGSIDSGNSGSLGNGGHTGRIDYVNQGGLGRGRGGRIARTTHG